MASPSPSSSPIDEGGAAGRTRRAWSPPEIALMAGSVLLITLSAFESLATTTIMPSVVAELGAESWFSVASGAAMAAQLLSTVVAGMLSDRRGPAGVLVAGSVLFVLGLALCAAAPHVGVFLAGRLVMGLGGGMVIVPLYVLVGAVATDAHRPTFFAGFSLAWVLPSLIGPAIAGLVTAHWGWRWVFGSVPVAAAAALVPLVPLLRRFDLPAGGEARPRREMGVLALSGLGAGGGILLLQLAGAGGGWAAWALGLAGAALTVWTLPRLVPAGTFRLRRGTPSAIATRLFAMGSLTGATAFLPLVLQRVHGWNVEHAAMAVTVGSLAWALGATLQARVARPEARARLPLFGTTLMMIGLVPVSLLAWPGMPVWPGILGVFLAEMGIGFVHSTLSDLTLGMTPRSQHGAVSSWLQVADNGGSALELALVSLALAAWARTTLLPYAPAGAIALVLAALAVWAASRIPARP
ncbi:MAG: MFS transporter [Actinomyces sp.]|nr:MFS transporter [Actinomyces sp.]MCI1641100.1 MFS transporter [Actinomyces sp.]MCI1662381.1 MFS transporter [Actinomyces sp.]MCI1787117.1 MFS transporter [Actinomyces sp.]MCI1829317.1 MFS transporter [Actinomyces sp.]